VAQHSPKALAWAWPSRLVALPNREPGPELPKPQKGSLGLLGHGLLLRVDGYHTVMSRKKTTALVTVLLCV
jgi:hypothetical protein